MPYKNKKDQAKASNRYYYKNKDKVRALNKAIIVRNKQYRENILRNSQCIDCGNNDIRVLEFDHVKGIKIKDISTLVRDSNSLKRIKEEIAKCEIRCANCHRIITQQRRIKAA